MHSYFVSTAFTLEGKPEFHGTSFVISISISVATNTKSWQDACGLRKGFISSSTFNKIITIEIT